jgi:hypothetical protein
LDRWTHRHEMLSLYRDIVAKVFYLIFDDPVLEDVKCLVVVDWRLIRMGVGMNPKPGFEGL